MRRLSHLFDFNQGSMARKVLTQKRHGGGKYYMLLFVHELEGVVGENLRVYHVTHPFLGIRSLLLAHFSELSQFTISYFWIDRNHKTIKRRYLIFTNEPYNALPWQKGLKYIYQSSAILGLT